MYMMKPPKWMEISKWETFYNNFKKPVWGFLGFFKGPEKGKTPLLAMEKEGYI